MRVGDAVHLIEDRWFHHAASRWIDWVDRRLLPDGVTLTALGSAAVGSGAEASIPLTLSCFCGRLGLDTTEAALHD